jgi:NADH dehydrogenase
MHADHQDTLLGLRFAADATGIRHRMLLAFEYAESEPDPVEQRRLLTFVVVGGGASGTEIAGEMAELANRTLAQDLYSITAEQVRIMVIEARPHLLPGLPSPISCRTHELLIKHGVTVRLGVPVVRIASDHVIAGDEWIETRTVVWATRSAPPVAIERETIPRWRVARVGPIYRDGVAACARQIARVGRTLITPLAGPRPS